MGTLGRYETTDLCHEGNQGCLAEQGRLTGHVRSRNDDNLLLFRVEIHIVGNVFFSRRKLFFNHRMASLTDIEYIVIHHIRANVLIGTGHVGKRQQTVQPGYLCGIDLDGRDKFGQVSDQFVI